MNDNGRDYVPDTKWSFKKTFIVDWDWWLYKLFKKERRTVDYGQDKIHNVEDVGISETIHKDTDESGGSNIS